MPQLSKQTSTCNGQNELCCIHSLAQTDFLVNIFNNDQNAENSGQAFQGQPVFQPAPVFQPQPVFNPMPVFQPEIQQTVSGSSFVDIDQVFQKKRHSSHH